MNVSRFIAKRITFQQKKAFTKVIINLGIAAVALSVTVLILSTSLFRGFKYEISDKVYSFWGHIHITDINVKRTFEAIPFEYDQRLVDTLENIKQVEYQESGNFSNDSYVQRLSKGGIANVYPYIVSPALIDVNKQFEGILLRGLNEQFINENFNRFIVEGNFIDFRDSLSKQQIVISKTTANRLKLNLSDFLLINFINKGKQVIKRLQVVGIYNTGIIDYDKQFAIVDLDLIRESIGWGANEIAGYEVLVDNLDDLSLINEYIYVQELPGQLYSETITEKFPNIFDWLDIQDVNELVLFFLMVIVSIVTMITTYLILILERTHTIGVLKSLGSTNWTVVKVFLYCAGFIMIRGIVIGNAIGLIICALQWKYKFIQLSEENYLLDYAPIAFDWGTYFLINAGIIVITLLFLLIPSFLISRIDPTKIFQFD